MSEYDQAREAVAALARAVAQVREAASAIGAICDPHLEYDLDALACDADDALIEFRRSHDWPEAQS